MANAMHLVLPVNYRNGKSIVVYAQGVLDSLPLHLTIEPKVFPPINAHAFPLSLGVACPCVVHRTLRNPVLPHALPDTTG